MPPDPNDGSSSATSRVGTEQSDGCPNSATSATAETETDPWKRCLDIPLERYTQTQERENVYHQQTDAGEMDLALLAHRAQAVYVPGG